eukprot:2895682-Pleurochrysis_carterae.AAC.1
MHLAARRHLPTGRRAHYFPEEPRTCRCGPTPGHLGGAGREAPRRRARSDSSRYLPILGGRVALLRYSDQA